MKRRALMSLVTSAALGATPPSSAQTPRVARIGFLGYRPPSDPQTALLWKDIVDELARLGWEDGRNLVIERRSALNDPRNYPAQAEELVAARVELIFAPGDAAAAAAFKATKTIPIVMHGVAAVELGYARSLARPGGNVTGFVYQALDFYAKEFDIVRGIRPDLKKLALAWRPDDSPVAALGARNWLAAAQQHGVGLVLLPAPQSLADIDALLAAAKGEGVQALVVGIRPFLLGAGWQKINAWAIDHKVLPYAGTWARGEVVAAFGPVVPEIWRVTLGHVDRILRGAKPADIPIEQPTRFDLVINRKLARAMGLTIPLSVLLQATEVIE